MSEQNQNEQTKKESFKIPIIMASVYGILIIGLIIGMIVFSQ